VYWVQCNPIAGLEVGRVVFLGAQWARIEWKRERRHGIESIVASFCEPELNALETIC